MKLYSNAEFAEIVRPKAQALMNLGRDEHDAFKVDFNVLPSGKREWSSRLTKESFVGLLPSGSSWRSALGWRSFFGLPIGGMGQTWVALGHEVVVRHETRGAYPSISIGLFADAQDTLEALAIISEAPEGDGEEMMGRGGRGVLISQAKTPTQHCDVEQLMLSEAFMAYRGGQDFLFRTLLLSESELRLTGHPAPPFTTRTRAKLQLKVGSRDWLIGVAPSLLRNMSWTTRQWVLAHKNL